jgi:glycosyltransferase involved in cell wall biosynthesis
MNSLVSVIMPYYSKKDYFLESINSVLKQTYINLEIIDSKKLINFY